MFKNILKNKILILITLLFLTLQNSYSFRFSHEKYSDVKQFLAKQKIIRIAADNTSGFGNQAASAALIPRLREMGFKGEFEFIYANLTTDKITTLFDLPRDIPDVYYDQKKGIEFIKLREFIDRHKKKLNEESALSMIAGSDDFGCDLARDDGIDVNHGMGKLDCTNEANLLDAKVDAIISPFYTWYNFLTKSNDPKPLHPQEGSDNKFFIMPVTNLSEAKIYLENDPRGQELLRKKPALKTFIDGTEKQSFNVLPVYGWSLQKNNNGYDSGGFPGNILQVIAGARYAQMKGNNQMHKPLIIPVFYNYELEETELTHLIGSDDWGVYEKAGAKEARKIIKELGLSNPKIFSMAKIEDIETIERIQSLQPGQILLLSLGPLPKTVFDGLYNHISTNIWPQIREGANTFNSLVLTGKPHVRCSVEEGWEIGFDLVTDASLKKRLENFYNKFCKNMDTWKNNANTYQELGDFIIEANDDHSAFSSYFHDLKVQALKKENDRIYYALDGVIKILNNE